MFGLYRIVIAENERVLQFRNGQLEDILTPGVHWAFGRVSFERCDAGALILRHPQLDVLLERHSELFAKHVEIANISDTQVGLVYRDGKLWNLIRPGTRQVFWKGVVDVQVQTIDVSKTFEIEPGLTRVLLERGADIFPTVFRKLVCSSEVAQNETALLMVDGQLQRSLSPGRYAFWTCLRKIEVLSFDNREQLLDINGQEMLTKDKVSLRVNLSAAFRVIDAELLISKVKNHEAFIYRELQFALRETVGTRTLDELLSDKDAIGTLVSKQVAPKAIEVGMQLHSAGIKDIILPGEMKSILNQVVEAEKVAQANLIKRREETAATRSLMNTARLMTDNPTLLRLKELEALEQVTDKIGSLTVFGGLDGVLSNLVQIEQGNTQTTSRISTS